MLIGQSVIGPEGAAVYYSPWMPRQGNDFTAVIEIMATGGGSYSFQCDIETKNNEDVDPTSGNIGTGSTTATAPTSLEVATSSGAKELVRYKLTATGVSSTIWVHFRSNPPLWQTN